MTSVDDNTAAATAAAAVDDLVNGKLDENLPITQNLIRYLQGKFKSPVQKMKDSSYLLSIIKSYCEREIKTEHLNKKRTNNDYDDNGINRFVASILHFNAENWQVEVMTLERFTAKNIAVTFFNFDSYNKVLEIITEAEIKDVDVKCCMDDYKHLITCVKCYRNCMMYSVGRTNYVKTDDDKEEKVIKDIHEFSDRLVKAYDDIIGPLFAAVTAN